MVFAASASAAASDGVGFCRLTLTMAVIVTRLIVGHAVDALLAMRLAARRAYLVA